MNRTVRATGAINASPGARGAAVTTASGGVGQTKGWSPTVASLLVILVVEIFAFAAIRYVFRKIA